MTQFGKETTSVLSQLTNSFLPTNAMMMEGGKGTGDNFEMP
jgi:hypothetical protein